MATTYQILDDAVNEVRTVLARTFTYTSPVFVISDVIEFLPLNVGETVLGIDVTSSDLDTHGTPTITLDVGDNLDADRFLAADTLCQAGGRVECGLNLPYKVPASTMLELSFPAAPETGVVGTITVTVYYYAAD